jgi:hypothetical protein
MKMMGMRKVTSRKRLFLTLVMYSLFMMSETLFM